VKVLDFGISKLTTPGISGGDMGMTRTQSLMGSPYYMSPEQMQSSKGVDARTDIWALGVILFELVTGRAPFQGETIPELVLAIATTPAPPARAFRADVPAALEQVIARCLEKDRERRYANVAELARALAPFALPRMAASVDRVWRVIQNAGLAVSSPSIDPSALRAADVAPPAATAASWGNTVPGTARAIKAIAGVAAGVVVLVLVVGAAVAKRALSRAPATSPPSAALSSSEQPPPAPLPAVTLPPPAETSPVATPAPAEPPRSVAPATSAAASKPATKTLPVAPGMGPKGVATTKPAAKPVCSAVPYLDSEGNTHFKQVCN
jgi:serine/threonine-protein kinase